MKRKSAHEPKAPVMSAEEVWADAERIAQVLRRNLLKAEPLVQVQIPLSALLSALDGLDQEDLQLLRRRLEERLSA
jgi:hypothetical protein